MLSFPVRVEDLGAFRFRLSGGHEILRLFPIGIVTFGIEFGELVLQPKELLLRETVRIIFELDVLPKDCRTHFPSHRGECGNGGQNVENRRNRTRHS